MQAEVALVNQSKRNQSCSEGLGERGHVEEGVLAERFFARLPLP